MNAGIFFHLKLRIVFTTTCMYHSLTLPGHACVSDADPAIKSEIYLDMSRMTWYYTYNIVSIFVLMMEFTHFIYIYYSFSIYKRYLVWYEHDVWCFNKTLIMPLNIRYSCSHSRNRTVGVHGQIITVLNNKARCGDLRSMHGFFFQEYLPCTL